MKSTRTNLPCARLPQNTLRVVISRLVLGTGTSLLVASPLQAASAIEEIIIRESARDSYVVAESSLSKFTEALSDTPQSITVLTEGLLNDRGLTSLDDALRNVPGITLGAGEMSWQGNNPTIRGFSSRNDMFLDGMRDFGSYYRDPFNLSSIEVLQGPSSMAFGRGSTGGVVNQSTKTPLSEESRTLHMNLGNAGTRRLTADLNQPFSDEMAGRLNLMYHEAEVPQRDGARSERYGIAPSLSLGLGDATQLTLSYMKLKSDDVPDYGLPWLGTAPAPVDRATYYGFDDDYIETDVDVATLQIDHRLAEHTRLQTLVRVGKYDRSTRITEAQITSAAGTLLDQVQVRRFMFQGESTEDIVQGQLNLISDFTLAGLQHTVVAGLEVARENSDPQFGFPQGVPDTSLVNPDSTYGYSQTSPGLRLRSDSQVDTLAAFFLDTLKFNDQWQVMAGLRWDRFDIDYNAVRYNDGVFDRNESISHTDIETSWRLALVYKPVENGTLYLGAGTSFNPSGEGLSFINSGRNLTIGDAFLEPENNRTVEVGTKWELFNGTLLIDAALFHIEKSNARVPDPTTPGFNILAGEQTVDGFSVNITGRLTQQLSVTGGYAYLDSEQGRSTQATLVPGTPLVNVPKNSFSGWLNYTFTQQLEMGFGARFVDERLATNAMPAKRVSDYWAFDAMARYHVHDNLSVKLNLSNLTDEFYFDQLHSWHVVPGPGLGAVFAVNLSY